MPLRWLIRIRGGRCEGCRPGNESSPAERRYETERAHAERTMWWADRMTRTIRERPSWEDLLLKEWP